MDGDLRLEMRSDPALLCAGRGLIRAYLDRLSFDSERIDEVVLATDEALSNAMRHGYGGDTQKTVILSLRSDGEYAYIEVLDQGKTADGGKIARKEISAPQGVDTPTPGGLGVQLIYAVCDQVEIEPGDPGGNRVRMGVKRPSADGQG